MEFDIDYTDDFEVWYMALESDAAEAVNRVVDLLEQYGSRLRMPHSRAVHQRTKYKIMELRVAHRGRPFRVLYAFDPRPRGAVLLLGADKGSDQEHWYKYALPKADRLYEEYVAKLRREGVIK